MMNAATAVLFLLSIGELTSVAEDWKKIARDTDEPALGQQVIHVLPQSQAERIGLKVGEFVVQVDEQQVRGFGIRNFNVERALFFVPKGGKSDYAAVESGASSVRFAPRPEVFPNLLDFPTGFPAVLR